MPNVILSFSLQMSRDPSTYIMCKNNFCFHFLQIGDMHIPTRHSYHELALPLFPNYIVMPPITIFGLPFSIVYYSLLSSFTSHMSVPILTSFHIQPMLIRLLEGRWFQCCHD